MRGLLLGYKLVKNYSIFYCCLIKNIVSLSKINLVKYGYRKGIFGFYKEFGL